MRGGPSSGSEVQQRTSRGKPVCAGSASVTVDLRPPVGAECPAPNRSLRRRWKGSVGQVASQRTVRTWLALGLSAALVAVACTNGSDVEPRSADPTSANASDDAVDQSEQSSGDSGTHATDELIDEGADDPVAKATPPDFSGLPSLAEPDPGTRIGTLGNGLRYLIRENDNPGAKADLRLTIDAGSALEDETQLGGAHYLEHMLFNGTERFPKNELIDTLRSFGAAFGADINAYTSFDETVYSLNVPNDDESVELALDVLEQWLSFALIDPVEVEAERGVILDEWRVRDQTANGRLLNSISGFFLDGTVYENRLPIGGEEAIEAIQATELHRFYDDWYRPDNAGVVVVGDIDVDAVESAIVERFGDETNPAAAPERPELIIDPLDDTRVLIIDDPDLDEGFAYIALPAEPVDGLTPEAESVTELYQSLAFDIIATRLQNDALRGDAPFDDASTSSSDFTRGSIAPEITISLDGDQVEAGVQAIADEYQRVLRFGFTPAEVERAVESRRSAYEQNYEGRNSRQDASYADEYVRHLLEGEWYVTANREFEFFSEALDRATAGDVLFVFADLFERAGQHVVVAVPADELGDVPGEAELVLLVNGAADRELEPRAAEAAVGDSLMDAPDAAGVIEEFQLSDDTFIDLLDPTIVRLENGATVAFNTTQIVEGQVFMEARSPGGLMAVYDDDVPDADALSEVIGASGVADFDPVSLDAFLNDKRVSLTAFIDIFEEGLFGTSATADLETYFQLIHLTMTEPRVDPLALEQYLDDKLPRAEDPGIDAAYAELKALLDARYDDPRFLLPSPESLASVNADGILRVAAERFGDASDWTFSFSGDFNLDEAIDLAARYLGSLPAAGRVETSDYASPPPPDGVVVSEVQAGQGEQANVSFQFVGEASAERIDDVIARVVNEVIQNRLTDFVREELGDSYSPFGAVSLGGGLTPEVDVYISVSTGPELIQEVSDAVLGQLSELRAKGPTEREFENAVATVSEELNFVNNGQINDEVLDVLVDPAGGDDFDDFVFEFELISQVTANDVVAAINEWTSAEQYIEVRVSPRP